MACFFYRAHEKCADVAPKDCGVRPQRPAVHQFASPLHGIGISPLSKVKKDAALVGDGAVKDKEKGSPKMKSHGIAVAVGAKR